jgi:Predicted membrane protein
MLKIYLFIWGIMSLITMVLYFIDKLKAKYHRWRIKETILLVCTFLFGSIGAFIGIYILHHKSKHWYFRFICYVSLFIHIAIAILIIIRK